MNFPNSSELQGMIDQLNEVKDKMQVFINAEVSRGGFYHEMMSVASSAYKGITSLNDLKDRALWREDFEKRQLLKAINEIQ